MLLYYITDRMQLGATESERQSRLLDKITTAAAAGVDFIQLREKDLPVADLESLARQAVAAVQSARSSTRILINSRCDVAIAAGADGVHLRSGPDELDPTTARTILQQGGVRKPVVFCSCHSLDEVRRADAGGVDAAVLAPVFEKAGDANVAGLAMLRSATSELANAMPVLALGGVTLQNAGAALQAGAAGIAGIRLFQSGDVAATVARLREI